MPQELPELVQCGCTEEPMPSGLLLSHSKSLLQHLWELSALGDLMITTAAVGEKEPGSV